MQKNWEKSIQEVNNLPSDAIEVIQNYKNLNPNCIKKMPSGKLERVEVFLPNINQFETRLIAYKEQISNNLKIAFYVLYNNEDNIVYKREIFNNSDSI